MAFYLARRTRTVVLMGPARTLRALRASNVTSCRGPPFPLRTRRQFRGPPWISRTWSTLAYRVSITFGGTAV